MELTLNNRLAFGKHKSKTVKNILEEEYDYITWLVSQNEHFTISKEVEDFMVECEYNQAINKAITKNKKKKIKK